MRSIFTALFLFTVTPALASDIDLLIMRAWLAEHGEAVQVTLEPAGEGVEPPAMEAPPAHSKLDEIRASMEAGDQAARIAKMLPKSMTECGCICVQRYGKCDCDPCQCPSNSIVETALPAGQQPTPMIGVAATLAALNPRPDEVLVDYGCGFDARFLITACRLYGTRKAIGVEIDPAIAESARRYVKHAGLSDRIEIITGDATQVDVQADVGVAYLWPETLATLRPKIEKLERFVSYGFNVPGLSTQMRTVNGGGNVYLWPRPPEVAQVPITRSVRQTVGLPRGSWCQVCGRTCANPMQHMLERKIVGYQTVPVAQSQATAQPQTIHDPVEPRYRQVRVKICGPMGCQYVTQWRPY
jgi:hypothetical protein